MTKATILLVDNVPKFLRDKAEFLESEGYRIKPAASATEARKILERGGIDLAILDIRLRDEDDEKDWSGLTLAKEVARTVPKIMLTNWPSVEVAREALKPQLDGLPVAVDFVDKKDGPEALLRAIRRALGPISKWLQRVEQTLDNTDDELKEDYNSAQGQSKANYWASLIVAILGGIIVLSGIALAFSGKLAIGIASAGGGIVTEVIGYLFFRRVDVANERMDRYHRERIEGQRFQTLLQACDGLDSEKKRERCREQVIAAATASWLADSKKDQRLADQEETEDDGR